MAACLWVLSHWVELSPTGLLRGRQGRQHKGYQAEPVLDGTLRESRPWHPLPQCGLEEDEARGGPA